MSTDSVPDTDQIIRNLEGLLKEIRTTNAQPRSAQQINFAMRNALTPVLELMARLPVTRDDFFAVQLLRAYFETLVDSDKLLTRRNSTDVGAAVMERCGDNIQEIINKMRENHKKECRHCTDDACPTEEETEWPSNTSKCVH